VGEGRKVLDDDEEADEVEDGKKEEEADEVEDGKKKKEEVVVDSYFEEVDAHYAP